MSVELSSFKTSFGCKKAKNQCWMFAFLLMPRNITTYVVKHSIVIFSLSVPYEKSLLVEFCGFSFLVVDQFVVFLNTCTFFQM